MKKLLLLLMLCPLMMISSCKDNAENTSDANNVADTATVSKEMLLDQEIKATNDQLPFQVDEATTLLSVVKDSECVVYEYSVNEGDMDFKQFINNIEDFRNNIKNQIIAMSTPDSEVYAFMSLLRDTGRDLRYQYTGNQSGKVTTIEFTNDELQEMIKDFDAD